MISTQILNPLPRHGRFTRECPESVMNLEAIHAEWGVGLVGVVHEAGRVWVIKLRVLSCSGRGGIWVALD